MYGPEAGSMATASGLSSATAQTQLGVNTVGSSPDDLVSLHESIARLLAVQGNWKRAYSHLHAALRLAREAEQSAPAIPEQFRMQVAELHRAHAAAVHASLRDSLTAAYNRRYLDQRLAELLAENAADPRSPGIAVALVDLDLFKSVNDAHGHLVGDQVLRQVVRLMQAELPSTGFCARYGGEEFVLVLPDMSAAPAVGIVERVRRRVAAHSWSLLAPNLRVTISAGLMHVAGGECPTDIELCLGLADEALYAAKRAGRNAVSYRVANTIRFAGTDDSEH